MSPAKPSPRRPVRVELAAGRWFCLYAPVKARPRPARILACVLLLTAALPAVEYTFNTGYDYSKGNYGLPLATEIITLPLSLACTSGQTTWELSMPYMRIDGPGDVIPGIGRLSGRLVLVKTTNRGLGDITLGVKRNFAPPADQPWSWTFGAEVKFGTASVAKSLGTGEDDFATHVDFMYTAGAFTSFATLGYRWLGNPDGAGLRDYLYGTVGLSWACAEQTSLSLLVDLAQKNSAGGDSAANFTLAVGQMFDERWSGQAYYVRGTTDATADHGMGVSLSYNF